MKNTKRNLNTQTAPPEVYTQNIRSTGLSDLQRYTSDIINDTSKWGFGSRKFKIKRHKLDNNTWQLTVVNPKTLKTILQAEGSGDTVFAQEDNLARMAETLMTQGLTIRTQFKD